MITTEVGSRADVEAPMIKFFGGDITEGSVIAPAMEMAMAA
tara:strand:+ start:3615 stop:3737 length:123 start_codon:yes stop_codon:yes gene_type:complete